MEAVSKFDQEDTNILRYGDEEFSKTLYVTLDAPIFEFAQFGDPFNKDAHFLTKLLFNSFWWNIGILDCVMEESCSDGGCIDINACEGVPYMRYVVEIRLA
ncbi:MAG: hypothetical protein A2481_01860 [Candidatus Yonathbacteria bacterium RIFOXYC2_FULL_47_9]|nr:MAG: hypothetical protein A2481_01860 [Candidatus Yonathbacteria bacterium RIFOXYC2_FULL_47_9]